MEGRMDVSLLNTTDPSNDGAWLDILDLDWVTPIGARIRVLGPDSPEAIRIADEDEKESQRNLAESFAGKTKAHVTADIADKMTKRACLLTKGWEDLSWGDEPFPYNEENALKLYRKVPHIRVQVLNFYRNRANFTKPEYANWRKQFGQDSSSTVPEKVE
jgi:hypothetical protein